GAAGNLQGHDLSAGTGDRRLDDAGREVAARLLADSIGSGLRVGRFRQYSAYRACLEARRLRLGLSRLCGGIWRLDDLVRLVRRRGPVEHVPGSKIGRPM